MNKTGQTIYMVRAFIENTPIEKMMTIAADSPEEAIAKMAALYSTNDLVGSPWSYTAREWGYKAF